MSEIDNPNVLLLELINSAIQLTERHDVMNMRIEEAQKVISDVEKRQKEIREALVKALWPNEEAMKQNPSDRIFQLRDGKTVSVNNYGWVHAQEVTKL